MQFLKEREKWLFQTIYAGGGRDGGSFKWKNDVHGETGMRRLHRWYTESGGTFQAWKLAWVNAFLQKGRRAKDYVSLSGIDNRSQKGGFWKGGCKLDHRGCVIPWAAVTTYHRPTSSENSNFSCHSSGG